MDVSILFLKSIAERGLQIQKYTNALSNPDNPGMATSWSQLKRLFHSLKSSAAMAGFHHLSDLAALAADGQASLEAVGADCGGRHVGPWRGIAGRGVDAIITDEPALAVNLLEQRRELKPGERALLALAELFDRPELLKDQ